MASILTYHVVSGTVLSADLKEGMQAVTVNGKPVKITLSGGPKINGVSVVSADIKTKNGVIHVIDTVILPPAD